MVELRRRELDNFKDRVMKDGSRNVNEQTNIMWSFIMLEGSIIFESCL